MPRRSNMTLGSKGPSGRSKAFGFGEAASAGLLAAVLVFLLVLAFSPERHSRRRRASDYAAPEGPAADSPGEKPEQPPEPMYQLPSLEGCPPTNHVKIRQLNADIDGIVQEVCLTQGPQGDGPVCPICLHGIEFCNGIYCEVEFRQTDRNGITKTVQCFCKMRRRDILANWERLITIDEEPALNVLDIKTYEERRKQRSSLG
ncbi:MAG: hypothetical protein ACLPYS_05060 [Vulcanimicrobiaceae bacterium]